MTPTIHLADVEWAYDAPDRRLDIVSAPARRSRFRLPTKSAKIAVEFYTDTGRITFGGFKSTTVTVVGPVKDIKVLANLLGI